VFPNTSVQNVTRPDERRRNPRLKVSSIIYAQVGSENGGIVTSLGIDGVAFQAAMKLIAEKNSTLNLRLRGSGLNVELAGELVWLGPTQKEVGVCFKSLSPSVRKDIADWIGREAPDMKTAATSAASEIPDPGPKPMAPILAASANEKKSTSHSLSAALAMSQAMSQATSSEPPVSDDTNEDTNGIELSSPGQLNPATKSSVPPPLPEVALPLREENVPANEIADRPQDYNTDLFPPPKQSQVEQFLDDQSLSKVFQLDKVLQSSTVDLSPVSHHEDPASPEPEILEPVPEPPAVVENSKAQIIASPPPAQVPQPPEVLQSLSGLEKWIPPALLAAWRQADERRRMMFASSAAGCLVVIAFIMILAMARTGSPSAKSATVVPPPPPANNPVTASASASPTQEPPSPRASHLVQATQPASFLDRLFGSDTQEVNQLEENQVGVHVWTSQSSGYYYCTDSDYYKTVQPGSFMEQGDALQSGYRPRLGSFCN
jgi:PilZ domain-containing protein